MLNPPDKPTTPGLDAPPRASLQLLLFVDDRPSAQEHIQQIQSYLLAQKPDYAHELQIIDIKEQPHLVEYFRLVVTPALVKIHPEPRQIIAGSNLIQQIKRWYPKWQTVIEMEMEEDAPSHLERQSGVIAGLGEVGHSAELMRLSDEIFRLKKEQEALQDQIKFKDQVLSMLAHDLRNPLTAASIAVDTLEILSQKSEKMPSKEDLSQQDLSKADLKAQLYRQARNQLRVMNRLITDILQASKGMSTELRLNPQPLHLPTLFDEILEQIEVRIQSQQLSLTTDLPQDIPHVYADEELIRQVFLNLLDNAIKYTPEGGKISVSILHRTSQKLEVSIGDTGPGIPLEKHDRIFEDHFRLQRDEQQEGYGLGLSLCRKIIRDHYGQIWVTSEEHQGSVFHITLPVYRFRVPE